MNKVLILSVMMFSFITQGKCQIPESFEFLNHSDIDVEVGQIAILDSTIIGASNIGYDLIGSDHSFEGVTNPFSIADDYKLIKKSDSIVYYMAWDFFEVDVNFLGPSVSTITKDGHTRRTFDFTSTNNNEVGIDMTYDTTGGWWFLTNIDLYQISPNGEIEEQNNQTGNWATKLFTSCNGDLYKIDPYLHYYNGTEFIPNLEIFDIDQMFCHNNFNYVLFGDELSKYDEELKVLIQKWDLPINVKDKAQIHIKEDDKLIVTEVDDEKLTVYSIDAESNAEIIYISENFSPDENINGVKVLSDSLYLTYGTHSFDLHNQSFYRTLHKNKELEYPKSDLELVSLDINYKNRDLLVDDVFLDSLILPLDFSVDIVLNNLNNEEVEYCDIFSTTFYTPDFLFLVYRKLQINNIVAQSDGELSFFAGNFSTISDYLDTMNLEVTGADYKFLKNGSILMEPNLISNIDKAFVEELMIFPNPVESTIHFENDDMRTIEIYNSNGALIFSRVSAKAITEIDASNLVPGAYFIKAIDNKENVFQQRFVKN